ncbi:MAG: glycosyltransferase [Acidimicrobiales bacterium]|nr:glycosyltransferase [Acidimicrobiales bacterium]
MEITVVAPTFRRADRLRRLVAALEAQDHPTDRFEVVIVDDASPDDTAAVLAELIATSSLSLRGFRLHRNGGPAAARNAGWRTARADVVAFVDDDCLPDPGWVGAFARAFARNDRLGVAQGLTRAEAGPRGPWTVAREIGDETPWFEGCNIAYRLVALEATGGFDEAIRWYGEDTSAGWKVVEAGWERDFVPQASTTHDLEERGVRWRIRHGLLESHLVALAAVHPGLRRTAFWRPWAFRRESVTLPLAVGAVLAAPQWPIALPLVLPYLAARRSLWRRPRDLAASVAVDLASIVGHVHGSVRSGVVVL